MQLNHDHIIKIRGMSLHSSAATAFQCCGKYNDYFVVMDQLDDTLDSRIETWKKKKDSLGSILPTILQFAIELASALCYLHERRLVFRDVKPPNCGLSTCLGRGNGMLTESLQLFDFGFCRALPDSSRCVLDERRETFHMSLAGTTRYMSPEIMMHQPYNHLSDTYSWAMTVYEMIARKKPYEGLIREAHHFPEYVGHMQVRPELKNLSEVPESLLELLQKAWCASIDNRPTMQSILEGLDTVVGDLPNCVNRPKPMAA